MRQSTLLPWEFTSYHISVRSGHFAEVGGEALTHLVGHVWRIRSAGEIMDFLCPLLQTVGFWFVKKVPKKQVSFFVVGLDLIFGQIVVAVLHG